MFELLGVFVIIFCICFTLVFGAVFVAIKLGWLPGAKMPWE